MKRLIVIGGVLLCGAAPAKWSHMPDAERSTALNDITANCQVAAGTLVLRTGGEVHVQFQPTEVYERADCVLAKLKRLGVQKMGFIGNEAYEPEKK